MLIAGEAERSKMIGDIKYDVIISYYKAISEK
jgi:hypothetical protein